MRQSTTLLIAVMLQIQFRKISIHKIHITMYGNLSTLHCNLLLFPNRGEKAWKPRETRVHICPIIFFRGKFFF